MNLKALENIVLLESTVNSFSCLPFLTESRQSKAIFILGKLPIISTYKALNTKVSHGLRSLTSSWETMNEAYGEYAKTL